MTLARTDRRAVRLAWAVGLIGLSLMIAGLVLLVVDWKTDSSIFSTQFTWFANAVLVGALGVLITTRRPGNSIGWLMLALAFANTINLVTTLIAVHGLLSGVAAQGWVEWPVWLGNCTGVTTAFLLLFLVFLFPTGSLPGPRWRWAARGALALAIVLVAGSMFTTATTQPAPHLANVPNPIGVRAISLIIGTDGPAFGVTLFLTLIMAVGSMVVRFRRSRDAERSQLRWVAYVTAAAITISVAGLLIGIPFTSVGNALGGAGFDGLAIATPATIGLAVMRYGLYDIDLFISRSIVYGSLAVFITSVYVGIAVGIGTLVGSGGKPNLGLSILATAIVAVGFQPLRERVQRVANRLVYGKRATPYEVLSHFSERVAESYASDDVLPRMARVLADGTAAEHAEVWLRSGSGLRREAAFPLDMANPAVVQLDGTAEFSMPDAGRTVEVRHQGELLGALTVTKRRGESLTPIELKLMDDLANQAGLVLKNVGLTSDLQARLVDLRASRQRLVAAQDDERRKLERNLHDGAQQHLVAIKVKLGLAEVLLDRDPDEASTTLVALKHDADEALETLRDLARGIYPPLLAEKGLAAALRSQAGKATVTVDVDAEGIGRHSQETESALYFCTLEALQNVQKYAGGSTVVVRVREDAQQLQVEVTDDGRGFDVTSIMRGAGLTNMEDRLDALGGTLEILSTPGAGTTLRASIPITPVSVAIVSEATARESAATPA